MKHFFIALIAFLIISCEKDDNGNGTTQVTVTMGPDYENDVYFSLSGGPFDKILTFFNQALHGILILTKHRK